MAHSAELDRQFLPHCTPSEHNTYEPLPAASHPRKRSHKSKTLQLVTSLKQSPPPLPPPRSSTMPRPRKSRPKIFQASTATERLSCTSDQVSPLSSISSHTAQEMSMRAAAAMQRSMSMELMKESESILLSEFISRFSSNLPTRVEVLNGLCSSSTDLSISQNEQFNLHFIKHTRVVLLKDSEGLEELSVPLNSSVLFGLLYNPNGKEDEAKEGFRFETAASLMAMKDLPLVVCATKAYKGLTAEMSVEVDEVLLVKEITKGSKSGLPGVSKKAKLLKVYSIGSGREKYLAEKCAGNFSTSPKDVRLHISTMVQNDICFPQRAIMFPDTAIDRALSIGMVKYPVILERLKGETSVVATAAVSECDSPGNSYPSSKNAVMDISSELDIQIQTVGLSDTEQRELAESTSVLYDSFTTTPLQLLVEKPTSRAYDLQSLLYRKILVDSLMYGIQLVRPPLLHTSLSISGIDSEPSSCSSLIESQEESSGSSRPRSLAFACTSTPHSALASAENLYTSIDTHKLDIAENDYIDMMPESKPCSGSGKPESSVKKMERAYHELKLQVVQLASQNEELAARLKELETAATVKQESDSANAESVLSTCSRMEEEIRELQTRVGPASPHPLRVHEGFVSPTSTSKPSPEENKEYLATLDCDQVLCLLDAIDLPQYKEKFQREHVDGEILLQLDEDVLQTELSVTSHIHSLRLLKLIHGRESAQYYLSAEGRYVVFTH